MSLFGIDTSQIASKVVRDQAVPLIGGPPKFWGRYFNGDRTDQRYQYQKSESALLAQWDIPVMCFARQMSHLTEVDHAETHANNNMKGVVDAFGASYLKSRGLSPILYLDVEGESDHPPLPQEYYKRWSAAICAGYTVGDVTISFRPAVYLNQNDDPLSWANLNAACTARSVCVGVSVANYVHKDDSKDPAAPPPPLGEVKWSTTKTTPQPTPLPRGQPSANIPILVWQYYGDYPRKRLPDGTIQKGDLDLQLVNPMYEDLLLSGTIPVPVAGS
jgi:hypothetical protein